MAAIRMKVTIETYQAPMPRPREVGGRTVVLLFLTFLIPAYFLLDGILLSLAGSAIGAAVCILVISFIYRLWASSHYRYRYRDLHAKSMFESENLMELSGAILLLRPFEFDAFVPVLASNARTFDEFEREYQISGNQGLHDTFDIIDKQRPIELFDLLSSTLSTKGTLIGVGQRKSGHLGGPGLLQLEDDKWQPRVLELMLKSKFIFIMPWVTPGTQWEIEQVLANNLTGKTFFVVPPSYGCRVEKRLDLSAGMDNAALIDCYYKVPKNMLDDEHPLFSIETEYPSAIEMLSQAGLPVPGYRDDGFVFLYRDDKVYRMPIPYSNSEMDSLINFKTLN